jgi:hypothetical protein
MSRKNSTGVIEVRYVPTIASKSAPTVAEITAGTDVTDFMTRDGLTTPQGGSTADASDAGSRYNSTVAGSYGGEPITMKFHRDSVSADDDAWTTFPRGTAGYLVVNRFGVAIAAAAKVEVWPIEVISREMMAIADNETQKFTVVCAVPSEPNDNAVVAA